MSCVSCLCGSCFVLHEGFKQTVLDKKAFLRPILVTAILLGITAFVLSIVGFYGGSFGEGIGAQLSVGALCAVIGLPTFGAMHALSIICHWNRDNKISYLEFESKK